jgi:hypothetical protein
MADACTQEAEKCAQEGSPEGDQVAIRRRTLGLAFPLA